MRRLAIVEQVMSAGGLERVLRGLAQAFLQIPEARDWDVTFLLPRYNTAYHRVDWPDELTGPRVHVEWLAGNSVAARFLDPLAHAQGLWNLPLSRPGGAVLARAIRAAGPEPLRAWLGDPRALVSRTAGRFDVVCVPNPITWPVPRLDVPLVVTPQDLNFKHFLPDGDPRRRLLERATREWLARASRILLTSEAVQEELRHHYPEHASRSAVVRLGVDVEAAPPDATEVEAFRASRSLPETFLLVTGWVMPHKDQFTVVEAMKLLRARGRPLPVVFAGPNALHLREAREAGFPQGYAGEVRGALAEAGFAHGRDFHALGYLEDREIRMLQALACAYVLPSRYEGFGLPSLEAIRAGCPTIVSAIPPLLEQDRLLDHPYRTFPAGDAAALADAVAWVLDHPAEARAQAARAADRMGEAYDWRATARGWLAQASGLLAPAAQGRPARP